MTSKQESYTLRYIELHKTVIANLSIKIILLLSYLNKKMIYSLSYISFSELMELFIEIIRNKINNLKFILLISRYQIKNY